MDADIIRTRDVQSSGRLDWDRPMIDYVTHFINEGDVVVDVGASIGDCTIAFQDAVGADGLVIAYEPHNTAYFCLAQNCHAANLVRYNLAVGDRVAQMGINVYDSADIGTSYLKPGTGVSVVPLDLHSMSWPFTGSVDFIKIDVEGMELQVLMGARELIMKNHPVLFVECYKQQLARYDTTPISIKLYLESLGYRTFHIYEPHKDWHWDYFNVLATA